MPHRPEIRLTGAVGPQSETDGFVPRLESLRGVAALIVAMYHIGQSPVGGSYLLIANPRPPTSVASVRLLRTFLDLTDGTAAVIFFLVLSGFVLTQSLARGPQQPGFLARRFVLARLFRIYPAVFASILVFAPVDMIAWGSSPDLGTMMANMLLWKRTLNGAMWSLQLEVLAIPLILAAYLVRARWLRRGPSIVLFMALLLVGLSFSRGWGDLLKPNGPGLHFMYAFLFGALAADFGRGLAGRLTTIRTSLGVGASIMVFMMACPLLGSTSNWRVIIEAASAAALVALVSFGPRVALLGLLDTRPMHYLGRVSYSFYLLHPLTLAVLWQIPGPLSWLLDRGVPSLVLAFLLLGASTAVTAVLAGLSYTYVEKPGIAAGLMIFRRPPIIAPAGESP
jgi:peptidoglycan/LPS O-acetylase OafA/YrhL